VQIVKRKPLGTASVAIGVLAILLALLADEIGVGAQPGFNWKQAILLAAGVAVALLGVVMLTGIGGRAVEEATDPTPRERAEDRPLPPPE
jgi:hypothetical protein